MLILTILIPLSIMKTTQTQTIQIQDLSNNPGLLTIKTGQSLIINSYDRLYHEVDLTQYGNVLVQVERIISGLRTFQSFHDITELLTRKFQDVSKLYYNLLPHRRARRGAFNLLGSGIKLITGNLDENDLIEINHDIQNLKSKSQSLIKQNNVQVAINERIEKQLNEMTESFNKHQNAIVKELVKAKNNRLENHNVTLLMQTFKISYHLDQIEDFLESVFETIQLAKLKIIPRNFLYKSELKLIKDKLEEQHVEFINTDQVYELLDIISVFKDKTLYFIILIPQLEPSSFNQLLLEPVPINGRTMKIPTTSALFGINSTFFIKRDCRAIETNTLCNRNDLKDVSTDNCFSKILRGYPVSFQCSLLPHTSLSGDVQQPFQ
ncbi:uncharacterized protein LOC134220616 [Armigeres subalbatus]|uniref:uncharacterized protein LOC134220616 n=1 Tax=Armigeres subalbatus TaxID=124917 RepID=UPI002ED33A31